MIGKSAKNLLQVNWNDIGVLDGFQNPRAESECNQDPEKLFRLSLRLLLWLLGVSSPLPYASFSHIALCKLPCSFPFAHSQQTADKFLLYLTTQFRHQIKIDYSLYNPTLDSSKREFSCCNLGHEVIVILY